MNYRPNGRTFKHKEIKENRQNDAEHRQKEYNKLTPTQRLARLDERLGKGVGAVKERKKLNKLIK